MANYNGGFFVGHGTSDVDGSYDPGACANGKQEHIIAEKIVDKAVALCSSKGLNIHRDEQNYKDNDVYGNTYSSKYIVSVHLNAGGGKRCEVYVPCKDTWLNPDFYMVQELSKLGLANGGVKSRDYNSGNTYVRTNGVALPYTDYYKEINVAKSCGISLSILEVGFIDSSDVNIIENNIDKIATIVANAMLMACGKELYKIGVVSPKWVKNSKGWWYDNGDGTYPTNKWQLIKGDWYYFDGNGYAFSNRWFKYKEQWYWFNQDCKMVKDCVLNINGKWYAFGKDGIMISNDNAIGIKIDNNGALIL